MTRLTNRRGFTLVELLVALGIITFLAAVAMLTVPGIMQKNRAVDASTQVDVWLRIARAKALRDKLPRGIRLIIDTTKTVGSPLFVTEVQYIESPPVFLANMNPPFPNGLSGTLPHPLSARVDFNYTLDGTGGITGRTCVIRGLTFDQGSQIIAAAANNQKPRLWMPLLGTWHEIAQTNPPYPLPPTADGTSPQSYSVALTLDQYPDAQLGAATTYTTYHFGIYLPPRPMFGEPAMQLPTNTCIDLTQNVSSPSGALDLSLNRDFDILFSPNGNLAYTPSVSGAGHVFLWIRDPRKVTTMDYAAMGATQWFSPPFLTALENGGEMMIVAIKSKGATAVAPVYWPTTTGESPYYLAQKAVAGP